MQSVGTRRTQSVGTRRTQSMGTRRDTRVSLSGGELGNDAHEALGGEPPPLLAFLAMQESVEYSVDELG
jgi:hypothetical protein